MPSNYNFTENGVVYNFDNVFVPAEIFRRPALWTWGSGSSGVLGTNNTVNRNTPVTTFAGGNNWKQVNCGSSQMAAIKTDGTLWLWGTGTEGQLGDNTATSRSTPVTTFAGGNNWKQVDGGLGTHIAAIKTDGTLWMWGVALNPAGELGINDATRRSTPVTTFAGGTNWEQVSSGGSHTTAIKTDGTLWTWGANNFGQLGINATTARSTPVTTFAGGTNWKQVSSGGSSTAAIKSDGTLWTWGSGQLIGDNTSSTKSTPVTTFSGGTDWNKVSSGNANILAIKNNGTLWTWGPNTNGVLGNNSTNSVITPVTTFAGGNNWKQISGANAHSMAIKTDGTLWIWGRGLNGALGTNSVGDILTPVTTFAGGNNWNSVAGGGNFSAAIQYNPDP